MTMPRPERQPGKPARSALARLIENWLETAHECSDERISPRSDDAESLFQLAAVYGFLCRTKDRLTSSDEWRSTCDRVDSLARTRLADPAMRQRLLDHLGVIGQRLEGEFSGPGQVPLHRVKEDFRPILDPAAGHPAFEQLRNGFVDLAVSSCVGMNADEDGKEGPFISPAGGDCRVR